MLTPCVNTARSDELHDRILGFRRGGRFAFRIALAIRSSGLFHVVRLQQQQWGLIRPGAHQGVPKRGPWVELACLLLGSTSNEPLCCSAGKLKTVIDGFDSFCLDFDSIS